MAIKDKDTLKTFFETGSFPSQDQFVDLIDSLRHQNDSFSGLSRKAILSIANRIESMNKPCILYSAGYTGEMVLELEIASKDAESQVIEIRESYNYPQKQYLLGNPPYSIKFKEIQDVELAENEYYDLSYYVSPGNYTRIIFGNNLPGIPEDSELTVLENDKYFHFQVTKQHPGEELNITHTNIRFINRTGTPIEYKTRAAFWNAPYAAEDTVTTHYYPSEYLEISYNADTRQQNTDIICLVYNSDTEELLASATLTSGHKHLDYAGGQVLNFPNIRIECITPDR